MSEPAMISAVILAAGLSTRMGRPKMLLPWGSTTVIGQVVRVLLEGGAADPVVVSGGAHELLAEALQGQAVRVVFNPEFRQDNMALSLQVGLAAMPEDSEAALVALGDQPQIEVEVVQAVIAAYLETRSSLVVPSYEMRRGHPWLIARSLWPQVQALQPPDTLRSLLNANAGQISYLNLERPSILKDLDTPEDYRRERPG